MSETRDAVDDVSKKQKQQPKRFTFYDVLRIMVAPVASWISFEATFTFLVFAALYVFIGFLTLFMYSLPVQYQDPYGLSTESITLGSPMPMVIFLGLFFAVLSFRGKNLPPYYFADTPNSLLTLRLFAVLNSLLIFGVITCTTILYAMPDLSLNDKQYVSLTNGICASLFTFSMAMFAFWTANVGSNGKVPATTFPDINSTGPAFGYLFAFASIGTVIYGITYSLTYAM